MCADHEPPRWSFYENIANGEGPLPRRLFRAGINLLRRGFPRPAVCCGHYGEPGC
jgi:hypothetical protein